MSKEQQLIEYYDEHVEYNSIPVPIIIYGLRKLKVSLLNHNWLDLGCGTGKFAMLIAPFSHEVIGVDYSFKRIQRARYLSSKRYPNLVFLNKEIQETGIERFTIISLWEVLEHLDHPYSIIQGLLENSIAIIVASVPINMPNEAHLHDYKSLKDVKDKFNPETVVKMGEHIFMVWRNV